MAFSFPEIWLKRVIENLTTAIEAPWIADVPELDINVAELGENTAGESNTIHIPVSTFEPDVLINNTTYPIDVQAFDDSGIVINLDKYQTKATSVSDDQIIGAAYDRIDAATRSHTTAILKKKYAKAIHALAPSANTANTPVIETTGAQAVSGQRIPLRYDDLVALKQKFDSMECPMEGRRLVLSSEHLNDLLLDRQNFGNLLVDYQNGQTVPVIAGFRIYSYVSNPYFAVADGSKIAFAAVPGANDHRASVAFYVPNIAVKTGMTKQYFQDAKSNPQTQQNLLNYRHYYIALPMKAKYIGAIISKNKA